MTRVKILALLVGMILLFTLPAVVSAQVQFPHIFVGAVTLDGAAAPDGTEVSAWVEGVTDAAGTATTSGGSYNIVADPGEDSWAGLTVTFLVAGGAAAESATFEHGGADELDLTATSAAVPTPEPEAPAAETDLAAIAAEVVDALKSDVSFLRAVTGSDGSDGQEGADGSDGSDGADGFTGPPGRAGADGAVGSAGSRGPSGATGASGVRGTSGSDGAAGSSGAPGAAGGDASSALGIVALILALIALGGAGAGFLLSRRS